MRRLLAFTSSTACETARVATKLRARKTDARKRTTNEIAAHARLPINAHAIRRQARFDLPDAHARVSATNAML
jgi:hypothetical protein